LSDPPAQRLLAWCSWADGLAEFSKLLVTRACRVKKAFRNGLRAFPDIRDPKL